MSLFPNPAATLPGEADILARVVADPSDLVAKLVYADWLQDRDDPRGPFLRTFLARAGEPWRKNLPDTHGMPPAWCDLVGISLMKTARKAGVAAHASAVLSLARPALELTAVRAPGGTPPGASRFGGTPDLPAGTAWPRNERGLLAFLAQFDLTELAASPCGRDLPGGLLAVFCDPAAELIGVPCDGGDALLLYTPPGTPVTRRDIPADTPPDNLFRECSLTATETLTLPDGESPWADDLGVLGAGVVTGLGLGDFRHQLLGHPRSLQAGVQRDRRTRHLLTLDSNEEGPGWMWGDTGLLYFTIDEDDFAARRFERAYLEMQCC